MSDQPGSRGMADTKIIIYFLLIIFLPSSNAVKCLLPKLGVFDCGDGECISIDLVCNGEVDCVKSGKDEQDCDEHFRHRCVTDKQDIILDVTNYTNFYLGYNLISGLTDAILDWRYLDGHVNNDCRRVTTDNHDSSQSHQIHPLLPYNVDSFQYHSNTEKLPHFQSFSFNSPYAAFLDLKRRKSIIIKSNMVYEDFASVTVSDAYQTNGNNLNSYWIDEQSFWQSNSPFVRLYLETVLGEFRLRPNYRLVFNPEFISDFLSAMRVSNSSKDEESWRKLFDEYGTHFPIGGTVGGSVEILVKRKLCPKRNSTTGHYLISMGEIEKCLLAMLQGEDEDEKWHCGKLMKKMGVISISDAIDWTYRKVIGGDESIFESIDTLPNTAHLENWTQTVREDPKALSTDLSAVCELVDRFVLEQDEKNESKYDEEHMKYAKGSCQRAMLDYVTKKDVLRVPERAVAMIPCKKDAVPVWRFVDKKYVLRGLPWCLSSTNVNGSCPAIAAANTLPHTPSAALVAGNAGHGPWGPAVIGVGVVTRVVIGHFAYN